MQVWRAWLLEDTRGLDLIWWRLLLFCDASDLSPLGRVFLLTLRRLMNSSAKPKLQNCCRSRRVATLLGDFLGQVRGWLPLLPEVCLSPLSGALLADVVFRASVTACWMLTWFFDG